MDKIVETMRGNNFVPIVSGILILLGILNIVDVHIRHEINISSDEIYFGKLELEDDIMVESSNIDEVQASQEKAKLERKKTEPPIPEEITNPPNPKETTNAAPTPEPTIKINTPEPTAGKERNDMLQMFNTSLEVELLPKTTVAYAVSFIMCHDTRGTARSANLVDASLVLRHSIHKISSRNPESGSKYDYKMYAFVHPQVISCSHTLGDLGFEVIMVDHPVKREEMASEDQRNYIRREFCCGEKEFIKLSAWNLPAELIVHLDIDFMFFKPMDHLF